jgi:hypothetical protein
MQASNSKTGAWMGNHSLSCVPRLWGDRPIRPPCQHQVVVRHTSPLRGDRWVLTRWSVLTIRPQRRKRPAALQVLTITELSLLSYDKYRRVALRMATDKVDKTRKFAGASHQLSYSKEARALIVAKWPLCFKRHNLTWHRVRGREVIPPLQSDGSWHC